MKMETTIIHFEGSSTYNPMGHIWEADNANKTINNRIQGYVQFDIMDGLSFRSQLGVLLDNRLNTSVQNDKSYYAFKNSNLSQGQARSYWNTSWLNTNTLSYVKNLMLIIVSTQLLFSNSLMIIISIIPVLLMVWIILIGSV